MTTSLWSDNWSTHSVIVWGSTSFILSLLFLILFVISSFQIGRFLYYRHRIVSYQMGFLLSCFFWSGFRVVFFLFINDWSNIFGDIIFQIPAIIQFFAFSLLVVYYVQQLYREKWPKIRKFAFTAHAITNIGFICFLTVYLSLVAYYQYNPADTDSGEPGWLDALAQVLSGVIFIILVVILGYYGIKVFLKVRKGEIAVPFQLTGASNNLILIATFFIVIIFITRSIYDFISAFGVWVLILDTGFSGSDWTFFFLYTYFEIIPCSILLLLFWNVGGKTHREVKIGSTSLPPKEDDYVIDAESKGFFSNDFRYDSDSEEQAVLYQNSFIAPSSFNTPYATSPASAIVNPG